MILSFFLSFLPPNSLLLQNIANIIEAIPRAMATNPSNPKSPELTKSILYFYILHTCTLIRYIYAELLSN